MERIREGKWKPMGSYFYGMSAKSFQGLVDVGHTIGVRPTTAALLKMIPLPNQAPLRGF